MTDDLKSRVRYIVTIGKFPVVKVEHTAFKSTFAIQLPQGVRLACEGASADIREGDLLTLYTEVVAHDRKGAH